MTTRIKKVYLCAGVNCGTEFTTERNAPASEPEKYVLLASQDVEFTLIKGDAEIAQERVEALKSVISNVRADAQKQVAELEEKIQSLLAISHQEAK